MILQIENEMGKTLGAIRIRECNEDGEIEIKESTKSISVADIDFDDIFDTNDEKVRIQLEISDDFMTLNYESVNSLLPEEVKNLIKELNSYCVVLKHYRNKHYNDCYIIIENYFGHINYATEFGYCKTHGEICRILLRNLLYSIEINPKDEKDDSFIRFCKSQINHIIYNLENEHDYPIDKEEIEKKCR